MSLCSLNQGITLANPSVVSSSVIIHMCQSASSPQRMRMKEQVGFNRGEKKPPKRLKGLQLSLYVLTATKGEKDEGRDGQAITSTGRQKKKKKWEWTEGPFPLAQKSWRDEKDYQLFMPFVKVLIRFSPFPSLLVSCVGVCSHKTSQAPIFLFLKNTPSGYASSIFLFHMQVCSPPHNSFIHPPRKDRHFSCL